MIRHILLIPTAAAELFAVGPCGARPPTVWKHRDTWGRVTLRGKPEAMAMPLVWHGIMLFQAIALLPSHLQVEVQVAISHAFTGVDPKALRLSELLEDGGTIVLVDLDGREVGPTRQARDSAQAAASKPEGL